MAGKKNTSKSNTVAFNRKARFNYNLEEELEAGIVLMGSEVKSLREGRAHLNEAHAGVKEGDIYLFNAHIAEYKQAGRFGHAPTRPRKLLLHKKEIKKILGKLQIKGMTLIPLSLYFNARGMAKVKIAVASGKKQYDKRETIKQREWNREKARAIKINK